MESNARDVRRVALEGEHRIGVRRLDLVQLDSVVASCGEEALVGRDAQAVHLRVGVWDRSRADAGERLPEAGESVQWARSWSVSMRTELCGHTPLQAVSCALLKYKHAGKSYSPVQRMTDMLGNLANGARATIEVL